MKIRQGFVSNSSSSSFICEVCGRTETGYDLCAEDAEMYECENFHVFCVSHAIGDNIDIEENYEVSEEYCPFCNYKEMSYRDIQRYFLKITTITTDEVFAEVKKVNKRRRKLYENEYVEYVLKANGWTSDNILDELKERFPKYSDFKKYLRG